MKIKFQLIIIILFIVNTSMYAQCEIVFDVRNPFVKGTYEYKDNVKIKVININYTRVKVGMRSKDRKYKADQQFDKVQYDSPNFVNSKSSPTYLTCDTKNDELTYRKIMADYTVDEQLIKTTLADFEAKYIGGCDSILYGDMVIQLYKLKSLSTQTYNLSLAKSDAKDITLVIYNFGDNSKLLDSNTHDFTVYKKSYWSSSLSAGIFVSNNRDNAFGWQSVNINDTITGMNENAYYRISKSKERVIGLGFNTLTHLQYHFLPELSAGLHLGLGTVITSGAEKLLPQLQYGLTIGLLKESRILINLGMSLARSNKNLSSFINPNSVYTHEAISSIDLEAHTRKRYYRTGFCASVTYQIL